LVNLKDLILTFATSVLTILASSLFSPSAEPLGCACRAFPHLASSLSAECADWLRACLSSTREVFPSNDNAKVQKRIMQT
jgi:hypothetical protein